MLASLLFFLLQGSVSSGNNFSIPKIDKETIKVFSIEIDHRFNIISHYKDIKVREDYHKQVYAHKLDNSGRLLHYKLERLPLGIISNTRSKNFVECKELMK